MLRLSRTPRIEAMHRGNRVIKREAVGNLDNFLGRVGLNENPFMDVDEARPAQKPFAQRQGN